MVAHRHIYFEVTSFFGEVDWGSLWTSRENRLKASVEKIVFVLYPRPILLFFFLHLGYT